MGFETEMWKKLDRLDKLKAKTIERYKKIYEMADEELDEEYVIVFCDDIKDGVLD